MNPLIPINAVQTRYVSPIFEPTYDEDDNVIDEECVSQGTNVLKEFIIPTSNDKIPRYYRLRYNANAKEHKRRWERWLDANLINNRMPYFVRVKKIGRRVLFEYDSTLIEKREKKLRAIKHKKETIARKLAGKQVDSARDQVIKESYNKWVADLVTDQVDNLVGESEQGEDVYENRESGDRYEER